MDESIDAPAGYDKLKLWAACYKQWTIEWQQLPTCRMTKIFFPKPNKIKTKKLLKHGRAYMRRLIECITGHNNLAYHVGLCFDDTYQGCSFCNTEVETFYHWIHSCPAFHLSRTHFFLDKPPTNDMSWSVRSLLGFSRIPALDAIIDCPDAEDLDESWWQINPV